MPEVKIYNESGVSTGKEKLDDFIFGIEPKESVVHQVYVAQTANRREPWAHVKDRGEVRGGGRKPWKQKGTGRARHGSIRSPIWVGGGITFGPRNIRNYKKKINKKVNSQAVRMCLSNKVLEEKLILLEILKGDGKTKTIKKMLDNLPAKGKTVLILVKKTDKNLALSVRNIPKLDLARAIDVNVIDLLHHQYVIADKETVKVLEKRFLKENKKNN